MGRPKAVVVFGLLATACSGGPTSTADPSYPSFVAEPENVAVEVSLDLIVARSDFLPTGLPVPVRFADPLQPWRNYERLFFDVTTDEGEAESVEFHSSGVCRTLGVRHGCRDFNVTMAPGKSVDELAPYIRAVAGQVTVRAPGGVAASIEIAEGRLDSTIARARRWPNVKRVDLVEILGDGFGVYGADKHLVFFTSQPIVVGVAVPNDGRIQVSRRGTITLSHRQPDGSQLAASGQVP